MCSLCISQQIATFLITKTLCSQWGTNWKFMSVADNFRLQKQADSCRSLTTEARVRSQPSTCEISLDQVSLWQSFSPSTSVFPCQRHSTIAPFSSFILILLWSERQAEESPEYLNKDGAVSDIVFSLQSYECWGFVAKVFTVWRRNRSSCRCIWNMQSVTEVQPPCTCSLLQVVNKNAEALVFAS